MFGSQILEPIVKIIVTLAIGAVIIALLPESPFPAMIEQFQASGLSTYVGYINYFFPVGKCITALTVWATAMMIYYAYAWILRQFDIISK